MRDNSAITIISNDSPLTSPFSWSKTTTFRTVQVNVILYTQILTRMNVIISSSRVIERVDGETRKIKRKKKKIYVCLWARVCVLTRIVRSLFFYVYIRDPTGKSKPKNKKKEKKSNKRYICAGRRMMADRKRGVVVDGAERAVYSKEKL